MSGVGLVPSTDAHFAWLLGELVPLLDAPGLRRADLTLAEAPDTSATVTARLGPLP